MQQEQQHTSNLAAFAAGSALARFSADTLSWQEAGWFTIDSLHLDGKRCPHCSTEINDEHRLARWYQTERIQCAGCKTFFTSLTNTILHGSTLDPREFYLLKVLLELDIDPDRIAAILSIHKKTVKQWRKRLYPESTSV